MDHHQSFGFNNKKNLYISKNLKYIQTLDSWNLCESLTLQDRLTLSPIIYEPFKHQISKKLHNYADKNQMPCFKSIDAMQHLIVQSKSNWTSFFFFFIFFFFLAFRFSFHACYFTKLNIKFSYICSFLNPIMSFPKMDTNSKLKRNKNPFYRISFLH